MDRRRDKLQRTTLSERFDEKSVEDILVNLPVKSLVRFKSVSKTWKSFIEDPCFIEMYRSKAHPPKLLISQQCGHSITVYSPKDGFEGGVAIHKVTLPWCMELKKTPSSIDGLFCFMDPSMPSPVHSAATCIYNPATRQITPWAQTTVPLEFGPDIIRTPTYGFGFDPLTKTYKLVCVWNIFRFRFPNLEVELHHICEVLTVGGENQWRKIDEVPPVGLYEPVGVYANGSIYWRNKELIVAFDVGTEKFTKHSILFHQYPRISNAPHNPNNNRNHPNNL
ncbi:hypothetical protein MKW92_004725 [Papaver armeniacum]|nr:hypothetical protein MKW92_004725 [Papaver armeniacum]